MVCSHASWKGGDQDGTHLLERGLRCVGEDERDASSPCLDEMKALQQACNERVAAPGDLLRAKVVEGEAFGEGAGVSDFNTVRKDGDTDLVWIAVIAVTEGIDDGLAEGGGGDFGDVHANEPFEAHADADVAEDVSFSLFNEGGQVAGEVVLVQERGPAVRGKDGAPKL